MLAKRSFRGLQFHLRCQISASANALFTNRINKNKNICSKISDSTSKNQSLYRLYSAAGDNNNNNGAIIPYKLADIGEGIFEVELLKWYVSPGDNVKLFDKICEVQSDKATVQITSRYQGTIHSLLHKEGDVIKVGEVLVDIDTAASVKVIEPPTTSTTSTTATVTVSTPVTSMTTTVMETTLTEITESLPSAAVTSSTPLSDNNSNYSDSSSRGYTDASSIGFSASTSYSDASSNTSYSDASSRSIGNLFGDAPPSSFSSATNTTPTTASIANTSITDGTAASSTPVIVDTTNTNTNITPTTTSSGMNLTIFTASKINDSEVDNSSINNTSASFTTSIDAIGVGNNSRSNINTTVVDVDEVIGEVVVFSNHVTESTATDSIQSPTDTQIDTTSDDVVPVEASSTASTVVITTDNKVNASASVRNNNPSTTVSGFNTNSETADNNQTIEAIEAIETTSATSKNINPVILASPTVRKLARDMKLRLDEVTGTGLNRRILKADIMKSVLMNLNKRKSDDVVKKDTSDSGGTISITNNSKDDIANILFNIDSFSDANIITTRLNDSMNAVESSTKDDVSTRFTTTRSTAASTSTSATNDGVINVVAGDDVTGISASAENITMLHESSLLSIGSNNNNTNTITTQPVDGTTEDINNIVTIETSHTMLADTSIATSAAIAESTTTDVPKTDMLVATINTAPTTVDESVKSDVVSAPVAATATSTVDNVVKTTTRTTITPTSAPVITAADVLAAMINGISLTQTPVATIRSTTPPTITSIPITTTVETTTTTPIPTTRSTNSKPLSLWHPSANVIATVVTKGNNNSTTPSTTTATATTTASIVNPAIISVSTVGKDKDKDNASNKVKVINGSSAANTAADNSKSNNNNNNNNNNVDTKPKPRVWTSSSQSEVALATRKSTAVVAAASQSKSTPKLSSVSSLVADVELPIQPSVSKTATPVAMKPSSVEQQHSKSQLVSPPETEVTVVHPIIATTTTTTTPSLVQPLPQSQSLINTTRQPQLPADTKSSSVLSSVVLSSSSPLPPQSSVLTVEQQIQAMQPHRPWPTLSQVKTALPSSSTLFRFNSNSNGSGNSSNSTNSNNNNTVVSNNLNRDRLKNNSNDVVDNAILLTDSEAKKLRFDIYNNNNSNRSNNIVNNNSSSSSNDAKNSISNSMNSNNKSFKGFKSIYDTNNSHNNSTNSINNSADTVVATASATANVVGTKGANINGNIDVDDVAPVVVNSGTSPMKNNTTIKTTSTNATVTPTTTTINSNNNDNNNNNNNNNISDNNKTTNTATTSSPTILGKVVPIRGIQRIMANNMTASLKIQHLTFCDEIYVNELMTLKSQLMTSIGLEQFNHKQIQNNQSVLNKISYLPIFIKMTSMALLQYPMLNATVNTACTEMLYHKHHNIGIAMDTKRGLIAPTIEKVEEKSILEIAYDLQLLQEAAATGSLTEQHFREASFTLSNIGSVGGTYAVPVVSVPQVAIGAFGRFQVLPRYVNKITKKIAKTADVENDMEGCTTTSSSLELQPRSIMNISWSADHRIIDGATIAKFSNLFKSYVESPNSMMSSMK